MNTTRFVLRTSLLLALPTHAATIKNLEFSTNGVLPSAESNVVYFSNAGLPEPSVYAVSNGLLRQRTFGVAGDGLYVWPDEFLASGTLDPALDLTMEFGLQVLRIQGTGGAKIEVYNGANYYSLLFADAGVRVLTATNGLVFVPLDITNSHTYRLEAPGHTALLRLFVDGTLNFEGQAQPNNVFNGFCWGDTVAGAGHGADVDWDFVRVSQLDPRTDCVQPPEGLVSHWKADGNANDTWSTNHGTLRNGVAFAPGRVGQAFSLDGANDDVRFATSPDLASSDFTLEAWIKTTNANDGYIFSKRNPQVAEGIDTGVSQDGKVFYYLQRGAGTIFSTTIVTDGHWHHVAFTRSKATGRMELHLDGVLEASGTGDFSDEHTLFLGRHAGEFWPFEGLIDEPSLFTRVLSASEIASLHAAGSAGMCGPGQVPTVVLDLQPGSDSGASNTDNLTTNITPRFDVTINRPGNIQFFHSGGTDADEIRTNLDSGTHVFTTPPLGDGVHIVRARFVPVSGNPVSASLAVTIDTHGPRIVATTPPAGALLNDVLDQAELTFDTAVDPATLNVTDASLAGPLGMFSPTNIAVLATNRFRILFPPQRTDGSYTFTLGPNVADFAGNLMDQDGDDIQGEPAQDIFSAHFTLALPDLSITRIIAPSSAPAGQIIPVSWTITNQGSITAIAPWLNVVTLANDAAGNGSQTVASMPAAISIVPGGSLTATSMVVLPSGMFGQKFLRVIADANNQVPETNETNNASVALPIQALGPDLVVESVAVRPTSPQFGGVADIVWTVRNVGDGPALTAWSDRIQLSTDTVTGSDTLLLTRGADDVTPLSAGHAYTRTQSVALPLGAAFTNGAHFVLAQVDIANQLAEWNEFNNARFSSSISITRPPLPDLAVADILSPTNGFSGHPVTLSWVVTNQGAATAVGPWSDRVLLAANAQGSNALPLAMFNYSTNLAAGDSFTRSGTVLLPADAFGDLFFVVQTDTGTNVFEDVNETNNAAVSAIRIHIQSPDLIVADLQVPTNTLTDRGFEVVWTVENRSEAPAAGSWVDRVFLTGLSGTNLPLGTFPFSEGLAPVQSVTRIQAVLLPRATVLSGDYRIVVVTDAANTLREGLNETNNTRVSDQPIHVTRNPLPDLVVSSIDAATNAFGGQTLTVRWTVGNTGDAATDTPVWYDRVLLATSPSGGEAVASASPANVSYLGTNEGYVGSANITVPSTAFGRHFFVVTTDGNGHVQEENEANNTTNKAIDIILLPYPDLQVTAVHTLRESFSAQSIPVTYTVQNRGGAAVPSSRSSWTDTVYLSSDRNFGSDTVVGSFRHTGLLTNGESYTVSNLMVTLPRNLSGTNYLFVATDTGGEIFEYLFEINNSNHDTNGIVITRIPGPDLVINSVSSTPNVLAGQPVSITWSVSNEGAGDTGASLWYDSVYVSTDAALDASDPRVGEVYHSGRLNPGDSYTTGFTYTPGICASGPHYFFVVTDGSGNRVDEYDAGGEANNAARPTRATQVIPVPTPDLQVTSATAPASGDAGATVRVSWSVRNASSSAAATGSWVDRVYLTRSPTFEGSSPIAAFAHNNGIAPGSNYTSTADVTLPSNASGAYSIFVATDADNAVAECAGESNNSRSSPDVLNVRPIPLPDLRIVSVTGPGSTPSGRSITVSWVGTNTGPGNISGAWQHAIYLSPSTSSLAGATFLGTALVNGPLLAGMSYPASATVQLPYRLSGLHYLVVYVDSSGHVNEGPNEQNNLAATPLQVMQTLLTDLQTSAVSVTNAGVAGQSVMVSWSVSNAGLGPTERPTWTDYIFLSRDQVLDASDAQLAYVPHSGALAVGQGYPQSHAVTLPRGLSGAYYIFVCADRNDVVLELDENNNCARAATPIQITLPPPVDLVVTSVSAPSGTNTPGQSATFNWTVLNQGGNTVSGSWQDAVYVSSDPNWDIGDPLLGKVTRNGPLSPGGSYPGTLTAALPGIVSANYYGIVRADILNHVRETNEVNNLGVSGTTVAIDIPELQLGVTWPSNLVQEAEHYYKVRTPSNETMLVTLDGAATNGFNELFTRFGAVPNRGRYDFLYDSPFQPDQHNTVPDTQTGTYYHLVRGESVPNAPEDYSIKAELLPFEIRSASPQRIGDNGQVTITLKGGKYQNGASVQLVSTKTILSATKVAVLDAATAKARFFLTNAPQGDYTIVLENPDQAEALFKNGVTIETATGFRVDMGVSGSLSPRFGRRFGADAILRNIGNVDVPYGVVSVEFPGRVALELNRLSITLPRTTDLAGINAAPAISSCSECTDFTTGNFVVRDMSPGEEVPFTVAVSGFPPGRFEVKLLAQPMSAAGFVGNLRTAAETARQLLLPPQQNLWVLGGVNT